MLGDYKRASLSVRLILILSTLSIVQVGVMGWVAWLTLHTSVSDQTAQRALSVAETLALSPPLINAVVHNDIPAVQEIAQRIQHKNNALFVVIGDKNGIRLAHPNAAKIGFSMSDDDGDSAERVLLHGSSYTQESIGSLGRSIRGKAAILDNHGAVIGIVSVGFASADMSSVVSRYSLWLYSLMLLAVFASIAAATLIAFRLKRELFGLEPRQIAALFKEREATLESIREAIIAIDRTGRITTFNQRALTLLDIPAGSNVIGKSIQEVLPGSNLIDVLATGKADFDQEVWLNGRQMVVNRVPFLQDGRVEGAVSSFRGREEIDLVSKKLTRIEQYAEGLQSQAHEYNNKLHTISGLIQIGAADKALALIGDEVADKQQIIETLTRLIPDTVIAGCILGKYNRARELGLRLVLDENSHFENVPDCISTDQFVAILGNLIDNALEATREHHNIKNATVLVGFSDYGHDFVIEVEDQGAGINDEVKQQIFDRGFSSKDGDEHGIGLYLIHTIVSQANGSIEIEDSENGGARFVVFLPKNQIEKGEANDG